MLYRLVNNCLSILQQYLIDRSAKPRKAVEAGGAPGLSRRVAGRARRAPALETLEQSLRTAAGKAGARTAPGLPRPDRGVSR